MVHNLASEGQRNRRKRSKKSSYSSYSNSCEKLSASSTKIKVQVREQEYCHESNSVSALPDGFESSLYQLMAQEMAYHPKTDNLFNEVCEDKVDARLRDDAVFNLRFLHKFYNLAPECFAHAVNITDRFLARIKVKPKYMACLATAAYLVAAKMVEDRENWPSPARLVRMARCGGSPGDLERMEAIIRAKLRPGSGGSGGLESAVTPWHFLALLRPLFSSERVYQRAVGHLETCLCSAAVYCYRPALLALCVARRYLGDGGGCGVAVGRAAQLLQLPAADLAQCDLVVEEAEDLRERSRRRSRRRVASAGATSDTTTWPGLWRLRCRRPQPLLTPMQFARGYRSCLGLDTIREEQQLPADEDCLPDLGQLFC